MGGFVQDLGVAGRGLLRRPGFAIGVALTLGLGIGATTTIFSVVDGVLLRPLPHHEPDRLAAVGAVFPTREWADEEARLQHLAGISMLNYRDFAQRAGSFERLAAVEVTSLLFPDEGSGPELASAARVGPDLFPMLGASPVLGRLFVPEEHGVDGPSAIVLSHAAWERRFGSDPDVVGRSLERVGLPAVIVGVLSPDFRLPEMILRDTPDFWLPLQPEHDRYASRGMRSLYVVGRLAGDESVEGARMEAERIADELAAEFPDGNVYPDGSHFGIGVNGLLEQTVGTTGRTLRIFLAAAALLLLLAALNAATLLLARSLERVRELAVRAALGAGRARMVRLLLAEATLLSVVAGAIGIMIAYGGVEAFLHFAPSSIPRLGDVVVDLRVLAVAAALSLGTGVAAGLLPALRTTRRGPAERLRSRSGAEPASRLRAALVGGQVTLAVLLLSGAGLLLSSFVRIVTVQPGFEPQGLVTLNVSVKRPNAPPDEPTWQAWDGVLEELAAVPGVQAIAGTSNRPFQSIQWGPRVLLPDDAPETWRDGITGYAVTPGYFLTLGTRVVAGRDFGRQDGLDAERVAIVNEEFVRTQMDGRDPLGVVVRNVEGDDVTALRVVGVVENVVQERADEGLRPAIHVPYTQVDWPAIQVVVRTELEPGAVLADLRQAVAQFSAFVPPRDVGTLEDRIAASRTTPRFQMMLLGSFAVAALLLAAVGLYGALSHSVQRRRRELGVRIALGAERSGVLGLVVRQGMVITGGGLALGLAATPLTTRVLSAFLFEVAPNDPLTLAGVVAVLLAVSVLACLVPARRATTVDPAEVLRAE